MTHTPTSTSQNAAPSGQPDHFVHDRLPPASLLPQMRYPHPELCIPAQANLVSTLFARAQAQGRSNEAFLRSEQQTLTYAQAHTQVQRIAQLLIDELKLVPGNRVLLRGGNSVDMALAWLGVVQAGLVAVATMPLLRAKELSEVIVKAQPVLALCDAGLLQELQLAQTQTETRMPGSTPLQTLVLNDAQPPNGLHARSAAHSGVFQPAQTLSSDDIALMAFTSGTTGLPKAVVHTHRDVLAACEGWPRHVLQARSDDIVMGSPPLAFTFGLGGLLLFPMWAGASVYFPSIGYTPQAMVELINQVGATICYTAPTFYRQMAPFAQAAGVPRLRLCVSAGEGLPDATRQLWKDATGIELIDGIGATEMFHIFISSAGAQVRRGSIGQVVPGYTARVVDEDGQPVPHGTIGRLAVQGPTGCRYLDDPRQSNYVKDGWNYPGDAFMQDADGYFFYQSRADDMIITAGYNIAGPEVEDALLQHPAVAECGVIGQPDEERGMVVKAFIVLKPGHAPDAATTRLLQDHVKQTLAPFKYPRQIQFLPQLPRTETGKLQRFKLRKL